MGLERQRIDKWLWHARVVRTRSAAAALAASGRVRLNGRRIDGASQPVRLGDVLTVALDRCVRVLKVAGFAEHRGSAEIARALSEDVLAAAEHGSAQRPDPVVAVRQPGTRRPTKRERRAIRQFTGEGEF
jgi:ribosome-associated heat shock protein Hsp15